MPGRRKRIPNIYNLEVPLAVAAHNVGAQYLLATFIKHLVFAREQCHAPFNELEKHVQACHELQQQRQQAGRSARLKSSTRKAVKYHERVATMMQQLQHIPLGQLHGQSVALLLGSSVLRPREVYCFSFPASMDEPGAAPPTEKQVSAAARQLLRTLVMEHQTIEEWDRAPGPTKMFLLFQAHEGALAGPPEGFAAKRAFSINLRKGFQVNINLSGQLQPQQLQPQQQQHSAWPVAAPPLPPAAAAAGYEEEGEMQRLSQRMSTSMNISDAHGAQPQVQQPPVWYQCTVICKGLRAAAG